jgi:hypothetical protein
LKKLNFKIHNQEEVADKFFFPKNFLENENLFDKDHLRETRSQDKIFEKFSKNFSNIRTQKNSSSFWILKIFSRQII